MWDAEVRGSHHESSLLEPKASLVVISLCFSIIFQFLSLFFSLFISLSSKKIHCYSSYITSNLKDPTDKKGKEAWSTRSSTWSAPQCYKEKMMHLNKNWFKFQLNWLCWLNFFLYILKGFKVFHEQIMGGGPYVKMLILVSLLQHSPLVKNWKYTT